MALHTDTPPTPNRRRYWPGVRRLTGQLLLVWFLVTFGIVFFARELAQFTLFGWPVSFYMAAQGVLLIYLAIVVAYAWYMGRIEQREHSGDSDG